MLSGTGHAFGVRSRSSEGSSTSILSNATTTPYSPLPPPLPAPHHHLPLPSAMSVFCKCPVRPFPRILPTELEETIISHLQGDFKMLQICAQVCRAWRIPSRYYLFASICQCVEDRKDLDELSAYCEVNRHFACNIKSITLAPRSLPSKRGSPMKNASDLIYIMIPLLLQLPSCHHLHLKGITSDDLGSSSPGHFFLRYHPTVLNMLKTTSRIVSLHLASVTCQSKTDLLRFIAALPHLRELHCDKLVYIEENDEGLEAFLHPYYSKPGPRPIIIRKLEVSSIYAVHSEVSIC